MAFFSEEQIRESQGLPPKSVEDQKNKDSVSTIKDYLTNPSGGFTLYGSPEQMAETAAQLSQTGAMTGYSIPQIGGLSQQYGEALQERLRGDDKVSQYMRSQRNRNLANVARASAGRGIAGGAAAASANQAQMEADAAVAAQMQGFQQQAQNDLRSWTQRQQKLAGGALAAGGEKGAARELDVNVGEGITVVCSELKRQNMLPQEVWAADHNFGVALTKESPEIMEGYHIIAAPIISLMQKSKVFTKLVAKFAVPWAYHIAGNSNLMGRFVMAVGIPLCKLTYTSKTILSKLSYN